MVSMKLVHYSWSAERYQTMALIRTLAKISRLKTTAPAKTYRLRQRHQIPVPSIL